MLSIVYVSDQNGQSLDIIVFSNPLDEREYLLLDKNKSSHRSQSQRHGTFGNTQIKMKIQNKNSLFFTYLLNSLIIQEM